MKTFAGRMLPHPARVMNRLDGGGMAHNTPCAQRNAAVLLLVLLAGCGHSRAANPERELPVWGLEEDLRIGSVGDPGQSLTRVLGPVIGPDGRVYVGQPQESVVRIYDRSGQLLRTVGRKGGGPGEFSDLLVGLGIHRDTLYVVEFSGRVGFFSLGGEPLQTVMFRASDRADQYTSTIITGLLPDGSVVATKSMNIGDPLVILHLERSGHILDTLFWGPPSYIPQSRGNISFPMPDPFPSQPLFLLDASRGRTAVLERPPAQEGEPAAYRITERTVSGDTVYSRSYPYTPIPLSTEEADSAIAGAAQLLRMVEPDPRKAEALIRGQVEVPHYYVPVSRARFAKDGSLWVEMGGPKGAEEHWIVHNGEGDPVARVAMPAGVDLRYVAGEAVWAVVTGTYDVPYLVRYHIVRGDVGGEGEGAAPSNKGLNLPG